MEYMKPINKSQEVANSVYVTIVLLITSLSHPVDAKDHVKVFMFSVSRCGLIAKSRNKSQVWYVHTTSLNLNAKFVKNLSQDSFQKETTLKCR